MGKDCPECGTALGELATYCGCGWGREKTGKPVSEPMPFIQCSYMACQARAMVRDKDLNYCVYHYEQTQRSAGEETCQRLGLKTGAEKRAWVMDKLRTGLFKRNHEDAA